MTRSPEGPAHDRIWEGSSRARKGAQTHSRWLFNMLICIGMLAWRVRGGASACQHGARLRPRYALAPVALSAACRPAIRRLASRRPALMTLVYIPANPVPEGAVSGTLKTRDGVAIALCALAAAGGAQGHGLPVSRARRVHREIFRDRARPARARFCGGHASTGAGRGFPQRRCAIRARATCAISPISMLDVETFVQQVVLPDCPPPYFALAHSMGGAVMHAGRACGQTLVRPHGAVGADDRAARHAPLARDARAAADDAADGAGLALRARRRRRADRQRPFVNNPLTSDPVRYARNAAILEEDPTLGIGSPTVAWADAAFRAMHDLRRAELSGQNPPADPDARRQQRQHRFDRRRSKNSPSVCAPART